jgi:hypothetical protein
VADVEVRFDRQQWHPSMEATVGLLLMHGGRVRFATPEWLDLLNKAEPDWKAVSPEPDIADFDVVAVVRTLLLGLAGEHGTRIDSTFLKQAAQRVASGQGGIQYEMDDDGIEFSVVDFVDHGDGKRTT